MERLFGDGFKVFRTVMAVKLGTFGEYVYLWDKLL